MKKKGVFLAFMLFSMAAFSQEFNCQVLVNATQLSGADNKLIFTTMQQQVNDFMNGYRFTKDKYENQEKIDCDINITVSTDLGGGVYQGTIQLVVSRPIFKAGIRTTILDMQDKAFQFPYSMGQPMIFNLQGFDNNLTSVLAYYAYVALAMDYDSFAPLGGTELWRNAQTVVNNAQSAAESGWHASDNNFKNRFVFVDNIVSPMFEPLRQCVYMYHRQGLDQMYDDVDKGRAKVFEALNKILEVHNNRPGSYNVQSFFEAKNQEIVSIFQGSTNTDEKNKLIQLLGTIDPANTTIYSKITSP
ncbi:MAG: DUF4835 family protein [Bacteroidetes bacterium]|nr:DUF4835 family protein [Bacteroidota bacterium]